MTAALNPDLVLTLRVRAAETIARDIRRFELVAPGGTALPAFAPGAHVLVQAPNGATRRYSLCNAPGEGDRYEIAVKREAGGRGGSISIVDDVNVGDDLHVSLPRNEFALKEAVPAYVFIAGGIGITPIRSMLRHLVATSDRPWKLYYLCREPAVTAWRDEFAAPELRGRVVVHHDGGDPARTFDLWPVLERPKGAHLYCCGPKGLMDAVRDMTGHWSSATVHFEDFSTRAIAQAGEDAPFVVRVGVDGEPIEVVAGVSMLAALRARGYRVRSSCESGTCGSCRTTLVAGEVDHRDLVLTEAERRTSIMPCVSRARSAEIVVEL